MSWRTNTSQKLLTASVITLAIFSIGIGIGTAFVFTPIEQVSSTKQIRSEILGQGKIDGSSIVTTNSDKLQDSIAEYESHKPPRIAVEKPLSNQNQKSDQRQEQILSAPAPSPNLTPSDVPQASEQVIASPEPSPSEPLNSSETPLPTQTPTTAPETPAVPVLKIETVGQYVPESLCEVFGDELPNLSTKGTLGDTIYLSSEFQYTYKVTDTLGIDIDPSLPPKTVTVYRCLEVKTQTP